MIWAAAGLIVASLCCGSGFEKKTTTKPLISLPQKPVVLKESI
jgi:hypothetical protein